MPWSIANASYHHQQHNPGVTEIVDVPNRGHALTIDGGSREVADTALAFIRRFVQERHRLQASTSAQRQPSRGVEATDLRILRAEPGGR